MNPDMPLLASAELADAAFQAMLTAGLALYRRIRQRWLVCWAAVWAFYRVRLGAIITFLASGNPIWLS